MATLQVSQNSPGHSSEIDPDGALMDEAKHQMKAALVNMGQIYSPNGMIAASQALIATCYAIQTLQGQHSPPPLFANNED